VLTIESADLSDDHGFVKDVLLNGKSLDRTYVTHDELIHGGDLKFIFSNEKDAEWSRRSLRLPYSDTPPH
jgi:putative alpha-1,2-mannosidase